jgi:hypothetical protein
MEDGLARIRNMLACSISQTGTVENYGAAMALLLHGGGVLLTPQSEWGIHNALL